MGTINGTGGDCARINYLASLSKPRFLCPLCVVLMRMPLVQSCIIGERYACNQILRIPTIDDDSPVMRGLYFR